MNRICNKCNISLSLDKFYKNCKICRTCRNLRTKEWRKNNPEKVKESAKKQYQKNNRKEYFKNRYESNKEHVLEINNRWKNKNPEKYKEIIKNWASKNSDKIKEASKKHYIEKRKNNPNYKKYRREKVKERKLNDVNFKIGENCRTIIYKALTAQNCKKNKKSTELLGCNIIFFKKWIESQFDDKMSWKNWGTYWEIDHVFPKSKFKLKNIIERYRCFNWTNCRPLEKKENNSKNNKIVLEDIVRQAINVHKYKQHIQIVRESPKVLNTTLWGKPHKGPRLTAVPNGKSLRNKKSYWDSTMDNPQPSSSALRVVEKVQRLNVCGPLGA